jgi:hypothetical protein
MTIKTLNENVIKVLSQVTNDNVTIGDVTINRKTLLESLKLFKLDDVLRINYGQVTWFDNVSEYRDNAIFQTTIDGESCIQISIDRNTMRFLNRPKKNKYNTQP